MKVLVIDLGGSHVKMLVTGQTEPKKFDSGKDFTPDDFVAAVREHASEWEYDAISFGYPGTVKADGPGAEAGNLGNGWIGYDFKRAFNKPIRIINDAAMQALGGYDGGRMLFLGLGTGLGSALIADRAIVVLELGCLPYGADGTMADRLGKDALARDGKEAWNHAVTQVTQILLPAFAADYIVLGGGNAAMVDPLPPKVRRGGNEDAFTGGFRLWEEHVEVDHHPSCAWRVVS